MCYSMRIMLKMMIICLGNVHIIKSVSLMTVDITFTEFCYRFDYSPEFLAWALKPPGYLKEWHCGVRVSKSNKLVGFISAVPAHIR